MNEFGNFIRRADLIKNLVDRDKLAEQAKKPNRKIQEANQQRWLQYQEIQRMELTAKIASANAAGGGTTTVIIVDADAQAFITAAAITDTTQQSAIDNLVIGLKADGLWTSMYAIYPFVGGTASTHKWNLKDPRDLNAAYRLQYNGGMTHSSNGILFNGTNGWADTSAVTTIASFGVYTRNTTDNNCDYMGTQDAYYDPDPESPGWIGRAGYQVAYTSYVICDYYGYTNTNNTIRTGLSTVTTSNFGTNQVYYKNGILLGTANTYGPQTPVINMAIGALNPNSNTNHGSFFTNGYSNQQIAFAFMGNSVFDNTQNTNLYNRVQTFQTALSRNV